MATSSPALERGPRPYALVTGASAGIGRAYAHALAARNYSLVLTARRTERLHELARELREKYATDTFVIAADLAEPSAPLEIVEAVHAAEIDVTYLVNNAGYGIRERFLNTSWETHAHFLRVMVNSWLELTHRLAPAMVARGHGRIVNVSSLASLAPEPPGSLYPATKCLMTSASRSLRLSLLGTGVHCTALCPGFTYTEFHDVLGAREAMNKLPRYMWQSADAVVAAGIKGAERNAPIVVPGVFNRFAALACRFIPYAIAHRMTPKAILEESLTTARNSTPRTR
jgi:short-subunit dehydrogenase